MLKLKIFIYTTVFLSLIFLSCGKEEPVNTKRLVIAVPYDVDSFNPMYAFNIIHGNISEHLFLSLIDHNWNEVKGELEFSPMLAKSWNWNSDSSSITFDLREDVFWSDSVQVTADDIIFSFDIYSDPKAQSRTVGQFESFYLNESGAVDIEKSIKIISSFKVEFIVNKKQKVDFTTFDLRIIPKHIFEKINREELPNSEINFTPISNGPYKLEKWDRNQSIILKANKNSFLYQPGMIEELIFKIVPEYNSRLTQLKNNEVDLIENVKSNDAVLLDEIDFINKGFVKGREYDYVGWNNVNPDELKKDKIVPNKFFGSANVRKALTYGINRKEILEEFLDGYGEIANSPVSPIFKKHINNKINNYEYNKTAAESLLASEGWKVKDKKGILVKEKEKFSITLTIAGGNPRRSNVATVIKNNLKEIGVDVKIETLEPRNFFDKMFKRELEAWIAGWSVTIPIYLTAYWHSDVTKNFLNVQSYKNNSVDLILNNLDKRISEDESINALKRIQEIINDEQPVTFLYWIDGITAYNNKIKKININPLGSIHHIWQWRIE